MTILDWGFVGLLSAAIVGVFFALVILVLVIKKTSDLKKLKEKRPKKKKNKKRWIFAQRKLQKRRKKNILWLVFFVVFSLICAGGAFYAQYYQATNLDENDTNYIVNGYYLTREMETLLAESPGTDNPGKADSNIKDISSRMASYGIRKASPRLNVQSQKLLNRYYRLVQQSGSLILNQNSGFYNQEKIVEEIQGDLEDIKEAEKKVLDNFSIDESVLSGNK